MSLALLTLTALLFASPKAPPIEPYYTSYHGQIQGAKDTTILVEIRYFLDETRTQPVSKLHRHWVDLDSFGQFEIMDLYFYYYPTGREFYWSEVKMLGMVVRQKSRYALGCGNMNQDQDYYNRKREAAGE